MNKQLIEPLASILTKIVNLSLRDGIVPRTLKSATATPLIKKVALDQSFSQQQPYRAHAVSIQEASQHRNNTSCGTK